MPNQHWRVWEYFLVLFIFLLPWQTRLILRPGILNGGNWEYGIIGVYGTEILLLVVFLFWLVGENNFFKIFKGIKDIKSRQFLLFLISLISLISLSILVADDRMIAWQAWRYIMEAIIVFSLIRRHSRPGWLMGAFLSGLAIQSVLGIWQFLAQSTLASRWLGLTHHFPWAGGSAVLENAAGRWLRAYGGLPHPNVFGGYLTVGLFIIVAMFHCCRAKKQRILLFTFYFLFLTALFFTFSRAAWLSLFICLFVYWFISRRRKAFFQLNLLILALFLLFTFYFLLFRPLVFSRLAATDRLEVQSTSERLFGYGEAWQLFQKHPLFGVGLGNYTLAIHQELDSLRPSWAYQPAHNIFVLMTSELGIIGMALLIILLFLVAKNINNIQYPISNILILFFILGFFDHYLWSLYSGWMLLAVGGGLGVVISREV